MGLKDVFDNAVKKPVTKAYTDDPGRAAVSNAVVDDGADVQVPSTVKNKSVLTSSYSLGCAAVSKIDKSVGNDGVKKSVLTSSYSLGRAAVSKMNKSVGNDGVKQKMKKYFPGPESRDKIVQALTHPATQEALKLVVPGGAQAANYLVESVLMGKNLIQNDIDEQNKYEHVIQQLKVMQAEIEKMQKQINKLLVMTASNNSSTVLSEQKPEEVIT